MTEEIRKMLGEAQERLNQSEQRRCVLHHKKEETNGDGGVTNDDGFVRQEVKCEGCDG